MSCRPYWGIICTELVSSVPIHSTEVSCLYQYLSCFCGHLAKLVLTVYIALLICSAGTSTETHAYRGALCREDSHMHHLYFKLQWHSVSRGAMLTDVPYSHVYSDAKTVFLGTSHLGVLCLQRTCSFTCCLYTSVSAMALVCKVSCVQQCLVLGGVLGVLL